MGRRRNDAGRRTIERVCAIVSDIQRYPDRLRSHLSRGGHISAIRIPGPLAVGTSFEVDVNTVELGAFVSQNRIDAITEPNCLAWVSYPPRSEGESEVHQIEVHWSFELDADGAGTLLTHTCQVPRLRRAPSSLRRSSSAPTARPRSATGCRRTLENVRTAAER